VKPYFIASLTVSDRHRKSSVSRHPIRQSAYFAVSCFTLTKFEPRPRPIRSPDLSLSRGSTVQMAEGARAYGKLYAISALIATTSLFDELRGRNTKRLRQLFQDHDRRIAGTALQVADIGAMDPGFERELFLRQAFVLSQPTKILTEAFMYVHGATMEPMSTIDLQTKSDIPLDFGGCRRIRFVTHRMHNQWTSNGSCRHTHPAYAIHQARPRRRMGGASVRSG